MPCGAAGALACGTTCNAGLVLVGARCLQPNATKKSQLVLPCKFSDVAYESIEYAKLQNLFTKSGSGSKNLFDYYAEMSYGRMSLDGSTVEPWIATSHTWHERDNDPNRRIDRFNDCLATFNAHLPNIAAAYSDVITVWNAEVDWGNVGNANNRVVGNGQPVGIINASLSMLNPMYIAHEMGHSFGLDHSQDDKLSNCGGAPGDYCDSWDIMSAANVYSSPWNLGASGPGMVAANRLKLGWLLPSEVYTPPASKSLLVTIAAVNRNEVSGYRMIKIPVGTSGAFYSVEFVRKSGWDASIPEDAVLVHYVTPAGVPQIVTALGGDYGMKVGSKIVKGSVQIFVDKIDTTKNTADVAVYY